jgi:predicted nucleotide-binding protein (sugar kinase/HSP70/actin superfamily)
MKITFPHMGNICLPLKKMWEAAGAEVLLPPQNSKRTLTLGTEHAPEFVCLPFKMTLGNFIEALELGADTILMAAGPGRCRFGFYGEAQQRILQGLGYHFQMMQVNTNDNALVNLIRGLRSTVPGLSWVKAFQAIRMGFVVLQAVDALEKELYKIRPREITKGESTRIFRLVIDHLQQANTASEVKEIEEYGLHLMRQVPVQGKRPILRIGLLGEIYVVLEPYTTADIERRLGEMGVEVTKYLYPSDWALFNLFIKALRLYPEHRTAVAAAKPYLNYSVGGDGLKTVGQTVLCAEDGFDGVIQLYPFTCMPEIVAQYMLPRIQEDFKIPVLILGVDEHTGVAGMQTRLEAFVDLVRRKREGIGSGEKPQ